jgi:hypothetical protein
LSRLEEIQKMSLVDNQEPQFAASTTMTSSSSTTTTTGKRKHGSDESIGASTTALTTAVADEAELTSHTSNASLTSMPLWVCAEILSFLDLASILNLTEVSVGVRAAFRTTVTAASIMANIVAQPCVNHRIDLSTDSGDTAWTKLRRAFNAWWCPPPPSLPVKEQQSLSTLTPSCGSQFRPFQYTALPRQMGRNLGPCHGVWRG